MNLVVYGSWHLAEVYAIGLCELGNTVTLICNEKVAQGYKNGAPPVFEPEISEGVLKHLSTGKLIIRTAPIKGSGDICFFAQDVISTDAGVDMSDIETHFDSIAASGLFMTICISSQLPIGTCRRWQVTYPKINIVYFPEYLRFGDALERFLHPDYIVLGGDTSSVNVILDVFVTVQSPKFSVSLEEAEMSKHAANIFVAMTVSFISELTKFSEHFDVDLSKVGSILRCDKRIGEKAYTLPGLGFSGTVERDINVLLNEAKKNGFHLPLFEQVKAVNNTHNAFMEAQLKLRFPNIQGKQIGILGATYKPFTSNMRGSLVMPLISWLIQAGASVKLFDPLIEKNEYSVPDVHQAFSGSDAIVIAVAKKEFRELDIASLADVMKSKIIIDPANMLPKKWSSDNQEIDYVCIGRGITKITKNK